MLPIRTTLALSGGRVTLRAWPASVGDARLLDLLTLTATLGALLEAPDSYHHGDVEPGVWAALWRLVDASLEEGERLPAPLTWGDTLSLMAALYDLNDVAEAEGKLRGLMERSSRLLERLRRQAEQKGRPTPPSTSG